MTTTQRTEVKALVAHFEQMPYDETATFSQLNQVAGIDVRGSESWILQRAIKLVGRNGIPIVSVRSVGYRRLAPVPGLNHAGTKTLQRTKRIATAGKRLMNAILPTANELTRQEKSDAMRQMCALGLVELLAQPKSVKHLPEKLPQIDPFAQLRAALGLKPGDLEGNGVDDE